MKQDEEKTDVSKWTKYSVNCPTDVVTRLCKLSGSDTNNEHDIVYEESHSMYNHLQRTQPWSKALASQEVSDLCESNDH